MAMVYHYTSPEGIFNIIKYKTLWFTDSQFFNDMNELAYIREPLRAALGKIYPEDISNSMLNLMLKYSYQEETYNQKVRDKINKELSENAEVDLFDFCNEHKDEFERMVNSFRYYVFCVSKSSDTTAMWNYYVKNGSYQGYNLGFDIDTVRNKLSNTNIELISDYVIYDPDEQVEIILNAINNIDSAMNILYEDLKKVFDSNIEYIRVEAIYSIINRLKFFFKNPAFKSEEEYRFVFKIPTDFEKSADGKLALKYRPGASGVITPYIEWKFAEDNESISEVIEEITLAPMIEEEIAKEGFRRFLANDDIKINTSSVKLRF